MRGAGKICRDIISQVVALDYCKILFIADKNADNIGDVYGYDVVPPEIIKETVFDFVVIAAGQNFTDEIYDELCGLGVNQDKIVRLVKYCVAAPQNCVAAPRRGYFSQFGEELVIRSIFDKLGIEKPSYLDLGSNEPFAGSNTAAFYESGSRGVCVDANPMMINKMKAARPEDKCINVGVGKESARLDFYIFDDAHSGLSSFSKEWVDTWLKRDSTAGIIEVIEVEVLTIDEIVNRHCGANYPDLLDIDIEGMDFEAIESANFTKNPPKVICVECPNLQGTNTMMRKKGFTPYCVLGGDMTSGNMIYIRSDLIDDVLKNTTREN